jgi:tRNA-2-methylthio-N6-dimethylallyladenosine synthase
MNVANLDANARRFKPIQLAQPVANPKKWVEPIGQLGRPPKVHFWHIGCQMNDADREYLGRELAQAGCVIEVPLEDADLAVMITCAVRQNAEQKAYGKAWELVEWKKQRPGRAIAFTGCMANEHGAALLDKLPQLDYIFDVREPEGFIAKLQAVWAGDLDGPQAMPASDRLCAYVPVIGGCNEMCTYCIVPFVRGREISRTPEKVVSDVRGLVERGVKEVTLLGQNVNSYVDPKSGSRLWHLMEAVDSVKGLARLRFLTSHPRNASPDLFAAMRDLRSACECLHLPVQSGSNQVLERMKRVYTVDEYRAVIETARSTVPNLALTTDIIVGFCGETEEEFLQTEALMREIQFDVVHLAAYSPRPGTAAARREDDVPPDVKKRRLNHLLELQRQISGQRNEKLVGSEVEILVEGTGEDGRRYGRTRQNRMGWFEAPSAAAGDVVIGRVASANSWQLQVEVKTAA